MPVEGPTSVPAKGAWATLTAGEGHVFVGEVDRCDDVPGGQPGRALRVAGRIRPPWSLASGRWRQCPGELLEFGEAQRDGLTEPA